VVDVGSLNGTYVNREPVDSAVLANGDEVQIGKFRLVFLTGPKGDDDGGSGG
jgi:pSer/pThr/pTyr-binding forkhead associated (FHA) protein